MLAASLSSRLPGAADHVRILEATSDFVAMASGDGTIVYLNSAGRKRLGWPESGPLVDRYLSEMHPAWACEIVLHEGLPSAIAHGTWDGETALLDQMGREIPISHVIISHPGADGEVEFVSMIMRDITDRKREEVARIEVANRYDAAIRASGQVLFDWNSGTNDIQYGGDIQHLLGFTSREMEGGLERLRECIHVEDRSAFDDEVARVTATRDPFRLELRMQRKDGREIVVDAKGYFFLDRQGHIERMVGFLADVTAQRHAQQELTRAHDHLEVRVEERTAELARTYLVIRERALQQEVVAELGRRALAGARLEDLFQEAAGLVRSTLQVDFCSVLERTSDGLELVVRGAAGWRERAYGHRVPSGHASQAGYTLLIGQPVIVESMTAETRFGISELVRKSGAESGISVAIAGEIDPMGVVCAFSMRRRSFTQDDVHFLQSIANILTAAIERRRAEESIRLAQEQAEKANRAKSEFLSRMSHELRTPLNAILGFTQLLEMDEPTPVQAESISHISRAGQHLLLLINEVLDIARLEAGRLVLSIAPVEMAPFLTNVVADMEPLALRHEVILSLDPGCQGVRYVLADPQRLRQVLMNLISNGVKYNRKGGRVTVSAQTTADSRVRLTVTDTGNGLSPAKMERLFIPFERLGAEATGVEGAGVGLALSQRIMTALNGEIGAESIPGVGSTFWFELPAASPEAPAESGTIEAPSGALTNGSPARRKILYVEDQDLNLRLVERILASRPEYQLITAMQGGLALDIAREHQPDLILLDLNLPDMSGDEVLRRLKADEQLSSIPVVMVSGDARGDHIEKLLALGALDYLTKPYRVAEFLGVIERALPAFT